LPPSRFSFCNEVHYHDIHPPSHLARRRPTTWQDMHTHRVAHDQDLIALSHQRTHELTWFSGDSMVVR
jgi:hypothetical protein